MKTVKHPFMKKVHPLKYFLDLKIFVVYLFSLIIISLIITGNLSQKFGDIRSRAQTYNPEYCSSNCGGDKDPCTGTQIINNGTNLYDPVCCGNIQRTGDPKQCDWPWRGWCFPGECSTIPGDVSRERCAAPRGVYCDRCKENGCYNTVSPTSPPPTSTPTASIPSPTDNLQPTTSNNPTVNPTSYNRPTEPLYTVTPPPYSSPTRPYIPNPIPTYYFPPTGSISSTNPSSGPQPTTSNTKPIINLPNPEPVIRKIINDTGILMQKIKNSLEDFFRVVLP